jgi:hypothetical protein
VIGEARKIQNFKFVPRLAALYARIVRTALRGKARQKYGAKKYGAKTRQSAAKAQGKSMVKARGKK